MRQYSQDLPNKSMKLEVSIIIVNWNTKDLVVDCINSILDSTPRVSYEIIAVDNGSEDGSIGYLKTQNSKLKVTSQKLKLILNKRNLGFARAVNQGIKVAKGDYVLLLNSDTIVKKGTLDQLYEFAKNTRDAGVVGARLLNPDGSIQASCFHFPSIVNAIRQYWLGEEGLFEKYAPKGSISKEVDVVVGAAFLITPLARARLGELDERYFFFYEDFDYCRRVKDSGLKVYYLPSAEVVHKHGSTIRKITQEEDSDIWRRLIPGSKIYNGSLKHYLLFLILWSGQKWQKFLQKVK